MYAGTKVVVAMGEDTSTNTRVRLGSTVRVLLSDRSEKTFVVGNSRESDPVNGIISDACPIGRALIGAGKGDRVSYQVGEKVFTVEVLEVW